MHDWVHALVRRMGASFVLSFHPVPKDSVSFSVAILLSSFKKLGARLVNHLKRSELARRPVSELIVNELEVFYFQICRLRSRGFGI